MWNQETGGASEQRRHLGKKVQNTLLAKGFSLIAIGNVLSKPMYLLSRRGLRIVPFSDTFFAAFIEIRTIPRRCYSWSGTTYCIHFFMKNPIDVLAGGRYAFGNTKLLEIYQRR